MDFLSKKLISFNDLCSINDIIMQWFLKKIMYANKNFPQYVIEK